MTDEAQARLNHAKAWMAMATKYRDNLVPLYMNREVSGNEMYAAEKEVLDAVLAYDLAEIAASSPRR